MRRRRRARPDRTPGPASAPHRRTRTARIGRGARLRGRASYGRRPKRVFRSAKRRGYSHARRRRCLERGKDARLWGSVDGQRPNAVRATRRDPLALRVTSLSTSDPGGPSTSADDVARRGSDGGPGPSAAAGFRWI